MINKLTFLKSALLALLFVSLFSFEASAQQWDTVGVAGFSDSTVNNQSLDVHNDTAYVAYRDASNQNKLSVQMYDGSAWVDVGGQNISAGTVGGVDLLVVDSDNIYAAYVDGANAQGITVMHYDGTTWNMIGGTMMPSALNAYTDNPSLAYTMTQGIHVSYEDIDNMNSAPDLEIAIRVKKFDGTNWIGIGLNASGGTGYVDGNITGPNNPGVEFGSPDLNFRQNALHIAYKNGGVRVLWHTANGWSATYGTTTSGFVSSAPFSNEPDLEFAPNDDRYIAYSDDDNGGKTTVAKHNGSVWVTVGTAGFTASRAIHIDLDFDSNGKPYVVQTEVGGFGYSITVYTYNGTNWIDIGTGMPTVYAGSILRYSNLKINNNTAYISFINENNKSTVMKYELTTNINQIPTLNKDITIYPNPTKGQLNIEGVEGIESIRILTMDGKVMETITTNSNTISVETLPQGVYTIEVITTEGTGYKNFVKQ